MKTYSVVPASAVLSTWISTLLDPVVAAFRFSSEIPVELRPTGVWRGWCAPLDYSPDGRVSISSRARFWRPSDLIALFIHEASHRHLPGRGHDPVFFCLNMSLIMRVEAAGLLTASQAAASSRLYDISDLPSVLDGEPDAGLGRSIAWAVVVARELAGSDLSAEKLAGAIAARFDRWIAELAAAPVLRAQAARSAALLRKAQAGAVPALHEKVWNRNVTIVGLLFAVVLVSLTGLIR
jgi:hypothetical protein